MTVWSRRRVAAVALAVSLAGCGASSSKPAPRHRQPAAAGSSVAAAGSSTQTPFHATFVGANHDPKIVVNWPYRIVATDAHGKPLAGTVVIEFTFGGAVVGRDPSGTHHLSNGRWHDTLNFPAAAIGEPLTVQAVIRTHLGTVMLHWSVTPHK